MRNVIIDKKDTNEWFIDVWKSRLTSVSQDLAPSPPSPHVHFNKNLFPTKNRNMCSP